jgi:hypothetical protein
MVRKSSYLLAVICLLLVALAPANVALAQKPEPPTAGLEQFGGPPAIDTENLPEIVQKATALQGGLTPDQHAAVRDILDKYRPEMQAIVEAQMAAEKPSPEAEPQPLDGDIVARTVAMLEHIDAEMAAVLSADQLALYRAVMQPALEVAAVPELSASPSGGSGYYTDNCYYCPIFGAYADGYSWLGYVYSYYNYYYYGTDYAYYALLYAYYGYAYSRLSLDYSGPTYFLYYYTGQYGIEDDYSYMYWAYSHAYYAEVYTYYAYVYAYYDYYYYGTSYGYYAYLYTYYAYLYADYGHYYCYYCYYYGD